MVGGDLFNFLVSFKNKLTKIIDFKGLRITGTQSLIIQFATVVFYIYLTLLHLHNNNVFYLLLGLSILQAIITFFYSVFLHNFSESLKSKVLYREDSHYILSIGIIKIISGSPLSGLFDIMLWTEVSALGGQTDSNTRRFDITTSLGSSSIIVLLGLMFYFALDFSDWAPLLYYVYFLLALGLICEGYVMALYFWDRTNLSRVVFTLFMLEDFYITVLLLYHFKGSLFEEEMRILLLLVVFAFIIIDLLYTILEIDGVIDARKKLSDRAFFGFIVFAGVSAYVTLPALAQAYVSTIFTRHLVLPKLSWPPFVMILFLIFLIVESLGFVLIDILSHSFLGYKQRNEDAPREIFSLSKFIEETDQTLSKLFYRLNRDLKKQQVEYEKLQKEASELKSKIQQLQEQLKASFQRGFNDAQNRCGLEAERMRNEFKKERRLIEAEVESRIFNLLFKVDYAPGDDKSKKEYFKKIRNELTKIYHPDHNNDASTTKIMRMIIEHYEKLTT